jgi:hypothetical protein
VQGVTKENLCYKITYTVILIGNLFNNNDNTTIIFSSSINDSPDKESEYYLLMNVNFYEKDKVPIKIIIIYTLLLILFVSTYIIYN